MGKRHLKKRDFSSRYDPLPRAVRDLADKSFSLLKQDPKHPSLHFKKIDGDLWSVRIGLKYRALAIETDDAFHWFWIGTHTEYDRMIS